MIKIEQRRKEERAKASSSRSLARLFFSLSSPLSLLAHFSPSLASSREGFSPPHRKQARDIPTTRSLQAPNGRHGFLAVAPPRGARGPRPGGRSGSGRCRDDRRGEKVDMLHSTTTSSSSMTTCPFSLLCFSLCAAFPPSLSILPASEPPYPSARSVSRPQKKRSITNTSTLKKKQLLNNNSSSLPTPTSSLSRPRAATAAGATRR